MGRAEHRAHLPDPGPSHPRRLVRFERHPQPVKPDRLVYELTSAGRVELQRWLGEPAERARGHRDDLFLKLLAASHLPDPDAVSDVLWRQRTYLLRQLHALVQAQRDPDRDPLNDLVAASAELHLRADLALLELAERTPPRLAAEPSRVSSPDVVEEAAS